MMRYAAIAQAGLLRAPVCSSTKRMSLLSYTSQGQHAYDHANVWYIHCAAIEHARVFLDVWWIW